MTEKDLAQTALNAAKEESIISVLGSFATSMYWLQARNPNKRRDFFTCHPIAVIFTRRLAELTRCDDAEAVATALDKVLQLARS